MFYVSISDHPTVFRFRPVGGFSFLLQTKSNMRAKLWRGDVEIGFGSGHQTNHAKPDVNVFIVGFHKNGQHSANQIPNMASV